MQRFAAALLLTLSASALGGCVMVPTILVTSAIELVDKTASIRLGMDCAATHIFIGDPYCRSNTVPNNIPPVYCYRTLGGVDCYAEEDPYAIAVSSTRVRPARVLAAPHATPVVVETAARPVPQIPTRSGD
jgi:hypothetical protein